MELYRDSAPSKARKLGSGGGSPGSKMTYQQVVRTWMFSQGSDGAVPVTARRAMRENGGLGEDPSGSTMTY
jgi:hypothetical protein